MFTINLSLVVLFHGTIILTGDVTLYAQWDRYKVDVGSIGDQTYTGKAIEPAPPVIVNGETLKKGTDYTFGYANNVNVGEAILTVKFAGDFGDYSAKSVKFNITKANPFVTAPTANSLTYNKKEQALVNAGRTSGGTMQYALGTDEETAPTSGWDTPIPTATNTGTYYVWYRVVGDENYNGAGPKSVKVTITVDKTALNKAIAAAEAYYNSIAGNTDYADIAATLKTAIDTAKKVAENDNITEKAVVDKAISALNGAVDAAKDGVKKADEKKAADEAAAKKVVDLINALPESADVGDKEAVKAARDAYDALTDDQKALVEKAVPNRLHDAETQVQAAEEEAAKQAEAEKEAEAKKAADEAAAKKVVDLINALPESAGVGDKDAVKAARDAYDALTDDQKKLVDRAVPDRLPEAETQVQAADAEAAKQAEEKKAADEAAANSVIDLINGLPASAGVGDKEAVAAARAAYDALTDDQKALVADDVLAKLAAAEDQVQAAEEEAEKINISKCKITAKDQTYTGKAITPKVTVKYGKKTLKAGTDYTLSYSKKLKNIGKATVTVKGKGKYTGSKKVTFDILPKGTKITRLTGGKGQIALQWQKQANITGYQIQYSLKKNFKGADKVNITKAKTVKTAIGNLKGNKTYYVRIRTYKKVGKAVYYSDWSTAKAVRTKVVKAKNEAAMNAGQALDLKPLLPAGITDYRQALAQ